MNKQMTEKQVIQAVKLNHLRGVYDGMNVFEASVITCNHIGSHKSVIKRVLCELIGVK